MISAGGGTGIFFLFVAGIVFILILWWSIAIYAKRRQQQFDPTAPIEYPSTHPIRDAARYRNEAVVRAEAGENTDGLPKYSLQARVDERIVDRNVPPMEMARTDWLRPSWISRPSTFRQLAEVPSRPPPAYDPAAPRSS